MAEPRHIVLEFTAEGIVATGDIDPATFKRLSLQFNGGRPIGLADATSVAALGPMLRQRVAAQALARLPWWRRWLMQLHGGR